MKKVYLNNGQITLVDDCDFDYVCQWKWYSVKIDNNFYAARGIEINFQPREIYLQNIIAERADLSISPGALVDFIDANTLNNQRYNLFLTRGRYLHSRITGVYWYRKYKKWRVSIKYNNKDIHLGYFSDIGEAVEVRRVAELYYGGI